jgi:hypothetical protein
MRKITKLKLIEQVYRGRWMMWQQLTLQPPIPSGVYTSDLALMRSKAKTDKVLQKLLEQYYK